MAESEPSSSTAGRRRSSSSGEAAPRRPSRARIMVALPVIVLISPLWQRRRKGWARSHVGAVFVL
jgi:hypothetical protein